VTLLSPRPADAVTRLVFARPRSPRPPLYRRVAMARWHARNGSESLCSSGIPGRRMEHLWSPAGATGGNRWQTQQPQEPLEQAESVATACHPLPGKAHGKEGVNGSSPLEGSIKAPQGGAFFFSTRLPVVLNAQLWSPLWSSQDLNRNMVPERHAHSRLKEWPGRPFLGPIGRAPPW
jgi:hypothetical protein